MTKQALGLLRYMVRQGKPLFGGPMQRGVLWREYSDPIPHLVESGCIVPDREGFRLTPKGRAEVEWNKQQNR